MTFATLLDEWADAPTQLLLLDKGKWSYTASNRAIKRLYQLITTCTTSIKSRGGRALPLELWFMIFDYATKDLEKMEEEVESVCVLVQAEFIRQVSDSTFLRCLEVELDCSLMCGSLRICPRFHPQPQ